MGGSNRALQLIDDDLLSGQLAEHRACGHSRTAGKLPVFSSAVIGTGSGSSPRTRT